MKIEIDKAEFDTIIAALRLWSWELVKWDEGNASGICGALVEVAKDQTGLMLDPTDVDTLVSCLNCGDRDL